MAARIKTPIGEAVVEDGVWKSGNKELEEILNNIEQQTDFTYYPNPDLGSALKVKDELIEVEILSFDEGEGYDPEAIY